MQQGAPRNEGGPSNGCSRAFQLFLKTPQSKLMKRLLSECARQDGEGGLSVRVYCLPDNTCGTRPLDELLTTERLIAPHSLEHFASERR
eukprot:3162973-Pleurochrysis_carterae.AAC.1